MPIKIKPLEWREDDDPDWWIAEIDGFGFGYEVRTTRQGKVRVRLGSEGWQFFDGTTDEAKAAAQADYQSRILSTLEPQQEQPVAVSETLAAMRIFEVFCGGPVAWDQHSLDDKDDSIFRSADWAQALAYARAALSPQEGQ